MNPFRQLFVGTGQLPPGLRAELMAEGPLFLEEGLPGSVTYCNYRRPRYRVGVGKRAVTGTIVVTPRRFVVWTIPGETIDMAGGHPLRAAITVSVEKPGQLCFRYRAEQFRPDRSGAVEVRLRTPGRTGRRAPEPRNLTPAAWTRSAARPAHRSATECDICEGCDVRDRWGGGAGERSIRARSGPPRS